MKILKYSISLILIVMTLFLVSCNKEINYAGMIDEERDYTEIKIDDAQMNIYPNCKIKKYYISGDYKVFLVGAEKGYVKEVELLVLLEGTKILKIQGVDIKETEGYGMNCFTGKFLNQFENLDLSEVPVITGKNTPHDKGEIIYTSHATVTSKAIISAINAISTFLNS